MTTVYQPRAKRGVSPGSLQLLEELERSRRGVLGRDRVPALIHQVASRGEPKTLIYLRNLLFHSRAEVRSAAAEAASDLIRHLTPHDWVWFDDLMRSGWWGSANLYSSEWRSAAPLSFFQMIARLDDPTGAIILGMAHGNGFIRESALLRVVQLRAGSFLPLMVLRLRDWVPEVRAAAMGALSGALEASTNDAVLSVIPLLSHLGTLKHTPELTRGRREFNERLRRDEGATLLAGIGQAEVLTRRYCFDVLREFNLLGPTDLFERAIVDPDPPIQEWAVRIAQDLQDPERTQSLRSACQVGRGRVRVKALRALWEADRTQVQDLLQEALVEPIGSVREFAIWGLRQLGPFDPGHFYRKAIDTLSGKALAAAVLELGRWGSAADASRIVAVISVAAGPRVRAAALRALYELDPPQARPYYKGSLHDESRRVARAARDVLIRDRGYPACERVVRWVRTAAREHTRLYSLTIALRRCPKWKRLCILLELVSEDDSSESSAARCKLDAWWQTANRGAVSPTTDERQAIGLLLARCEGALPEHFIEQIRFAVR